MCQTQAHILSTIVLGIALKAVAAAIAVDRSEEEKQHEQKKRDLLKTKADLKAVFSYIRLL
jgi:multisubunit Na+/H+ antiporter MnhC subunit